MEKQVTKNKKEIKDSIEFEQVIERGCGLDVHKDTVVATIQGKDIQTSTKIYSTFTAGLEELKSWLKENKITHVAMESTGVYWKRVINILGEEFKIILVNARHIKNVPGQKTDKKDSKWITKLLLSGLLKGSFIPNKTISALRELTRYRTRLREMVASEKNRFLKTLEGTNIKLSRVLTDVFCTTGRKIIKHILEEETYKVSELLGYIHKGVKASQEDILQALEGKIDGAQGYLLKAIMTHIEELEGKIENFSKEIEKISEPYREELELLKTIPGVGENIAVCIISEIGVDMGQFASHKHLASWAGISPGNNESAGKNRSGRIRQGNKWLKTKLVEGAWSAMHSKETYFQSKYRSLVRRKGPKKAIIALGHKILIAAYHIIKDKKSYKELGSTYLANFSKEKLIKFYQHQLAKLAVTGESLASV